MGVGCSAQGGQEIVCIGTVRHCRSLFLERSAPGSRRGDSGYRPPQIAASADLGGHGGHEPLLASDVVKVRLEPRRAIDVSDDGRDLDLVHREDHGARAAAPPKFE